MTTKKDKPSRGRPRLSEDFATAHVGFTTTEDIADTFAAEAQRRRLKGSALFREMVRRLCPVGGKRDVAIAADTYAKLESLASEEGVTVDELAQRLLASRLGDAIPGPAEVA